MVEVGLGWSFWHRGNLDVLLRTELFLTMLMPDCRSRG